MNTAEVFDIEMILKEASTFGLRVEVDKLAKELLEIGYTRVQAYQLALNELIKLNEI